MQHKRSYRKEPDPALVVVLQRLRHDHGLTQEGLAFQADLRIATLSRIERGVTDPAWSSIRAIAKALNMSLNELAAAVELEERLMKQTAQSLTPESEGFNAAQA
jgi:transcriptional regulator with XRE-family HTH domain